MMIAYSILLLIDAGLTCILYNEHYDSANQYWVEYYESNPITRYFLERGSLPLNLFVPYIIILILFVYGYNRYYFNIERFKNAKTVQAISRDELMRLRIFFFNDWKMFLPMYFMMLVFIVGHIRGVITYL
jgi:hypothetical protein